MKTSIEWLIEVLAKQGVLHSSDIAKAKEMEKNQIIDAYLKDRHKVTIDKAFDLWNNAEQYYNKTFKDE